MAVKFADLHTHTNRSDGQDTVQELIDNAAKTEGLAAFALSDHDIRPPKTIDVDGRQVDPVSYAEEKGLLMIPAIEISCDTEVDDVHIVGLFCNFDLPEWQALEDDVKQSKIDGYHALCDKLVERGMDVSWASITTDVGRPEDQVQRKMIFEALAAKGCVKDWKDAKIMVKEDKELNIKRRKPDPVYAIELIHKAGGQAVLAHPFLIGENVVREDGTCMTRWEYIEMLLKAGIDGMEVDYPYTKTSYKGALNNDEMAGHIYRNYASRVKFISGGSDYHAEYKKGAKTPRELGDGKVPYEYFEKMILPYGNK